MKIIINRNIRLCVSNNVAPARCLEAPYTWPSPLVQSLLTEDGGTHSSLKVRAGLVKHRTTTSTPGIQTPASAAPVLIFGGEPRPKSESIADPGPRVLTSEILGWEKPSISEERGSGTLYSLQKGYNPLLTPTSSNVEVSNKRKRSPIPNYYTILYICVNT